MDNPSWWGDLADLLILLAGIGIGWITWDQVCALFRVGTYRRRVRRATRAWRGED